MSWEAVGAIAESVGAFGVIATLIYLAFQIRSNTQENRLAATADISREYNTFLQLITGDAELSRLWRIAVDGNPHDLTEDERSRVILVMGNINRILENAYIQYLAGRMESTTWHGYERLLLRGVNASIFPLYWQLRKGMHTAKYGELVETFMLNPDTKPMFQGVTNDS